MADNKITIDPDQLLGLLPTNFKQNMPHWVQYAGLAVSALGYGWQTLLSQNPQLSSLKGAGTYTFFAGLIVTLSSSWLHSSVANQFSTAAKVAAGSPPVNAVGEYDHHHTFAVGVQQALDTKDPKAMEIASKVLEALRGIK